RERRDRESTGRGPVGDQAFVAGRAVAAGGDRAGWGPSGGDPATPAGHAGAAVARAGAAVVHGAVRPGYGGVHGAGGVAGRWPPGLEGAVGRAGRGGGPA